MTDIKEEIEKVVPGIRAFRRWLHQYPEPAFEEYATAAAIIEHLQSVKNIRIQSKIGTTGVLATLGAEKEGPCVALRADMDCLRMKEDNTFSYASKNSGLMHACGHDGHTAVLLGTAKVLGALHDRLQGPVKFIFQPAEENLGGARKMVEGGVLELPDVDAIFGLHGTTALGLGRIGLSSGPIMAASRYFTITVQGRGCHAASPQRGIDPVLIGSQIVIAAQSIISRNVSPFDNCLISIPKFTGSTAPNVIPERVTLEGTLRALSNKSRDLLEERLREVVEHTAAAHGGSGGITYYGGYPLLSNDPAQADYVRKTARAIIADSGIEWGFPPSLGAEDFAFYAEKVPSAFFWLGLQPKGDAAPPIHHPKFDFNDDAIPLAIRLMCELALGYSKSSQTAE